MPVLVSMLTADLKCQSVVKVVELPQKANGKCELSKYLRETFSEKRRVEFREKIKSLWPVL